MCCNTNIPIKNVSQSFSDFLFNHPFSNGNGKSLWMCFFFFDSNNENKGERMACTLYAHEEKKGKKRRNILIDRWPK